LRKRKTQRFCVLTILEKEVYDKRKIIGIVTAVHFFLIEKNVILHPPNYNGTTGQAGKSACGKKEA
jgi:hypothetical protein